MRFKQSVFKFILVAGGLFLALLLAEVAIRIAPPAALSDLDRPLVTSEAERAAHSVRYRPNTAFTWSGHAGLVKEFEIATAWNAQGFNDDDHALENPAGNFRIVVAGDSFVEALEVPRDKSFHQLLEKKLNERNAGRTYEVIALGRAGNGARRNYLLLQEYGLAYRPDLVLMEFLPSNDVVDDSNDLRLRRDQQVLKFREASPLTHRPEIYRASPDSIFCHSRVFHVVTQSFIHYKFKKFRDSLPREEQIPFQYFVYSVQYSAPWKRAWKFTMEQIKKAKDQTISTGGQFVLIGFNERFKLSPKDQETLLKTYPAMADFKWNFDHPQKILSQFTQANGIRFLNLEKMFAEEFGKTGVPLHYEYDGHWNEQGHKLAADLIYDYLVQNRLIP